MPSAPPPVAQTGALYVITGASRGLGAALAEAAHASGHAVLGVGRGAPPVGAHLTLDLARPEGAGEALAVALRAQLAPALRRVVLVHNAATLEPMGEGAEAGDAAAVAAHLALNLAAPIVLTRALLGALAGWPGRRQVVGISSGAATRAIPGWSLYGASKAGLEHFLRVLAAEQAGRADAAEVLAISPGVIDTGMQARIRAASVEEFPLVERFRGLREAGALQAPADVAAVILRALDGPRRFAGETLDMDGLRASA